LARLAARRFSETIMRVKAPKMEKAAVSGRWGIQESEKVGIRLTQVTTIDCGRAFFFREVGWTISS